MKRILAATLPFVLAATIFALVPQKASGTSNYRPPALRVAVVSSQVSQNWSDYSKMGYGITWRGQKTYEYLKSQGWNVTLRSDDIFNSVAELQKYDVIVLPYTFCMNPTPSANLQSYVAQGGGVVAMLGVPRIAPMYDKGPQEEVTEHWYKILDTNAMEWGPMSEVYQVNFAIDPSAPLFKSVLWPNASHPVLDGAKRILDADGLPSYDLTLDRSFSGTSRGGVEFVDFLKGNGNVKPLLSFVSSEKSNAELTKYPKIFQVGGYPSAAAAHYFNGRSVYFYFSPEDFLPDVFGNLANYKNARTGVSQSSIASALIDSAITWAGTKDGVQGKISRAGRTNADISVYQDGIYAFQYLGNAGNVAVSGQAYFRIYDPSGKLVYSKRHPQTYTGTYPGGSKRFAYQYVPGGKLLSGKYKVEVEYVFSYPKMDQRYKEVAYVTRGQGTGIKTTPAVPSASAVAKVTNAYFAPQPISPNGDNWNDYGYVTYSVDQPSMVTVKVYDLNWKLLAVPQADKLMSPGRYSVRFDGKGTAGSLGNGAYYYSIQAYNDKGKGSSGGVLYINRTLTNAWGLGTKPALSNVAAAPSPFASTTAAKFNLSATAWTVVKVFDTRGAEIRTLANNGRLPAGDRALVWDGRNASGTLMPNGTYRYYVWSSSGGPGPYTEFRDGAVTIAR